MVFVSRSHSEVDPTMSLSRNVTTPVGSTLVAGCSAPSEGCQSTSGLCARIASSKRPSSLLGSIPSSRERLARPLVRAEGVALAARPVQRQHQLRPTVFPQRLVGHQRLEIRDALAVRSGREPGVDLLLLTEAAKLVQASGLRLRGCPPAELREGRPAPLGEGRGIHREAVAWDAPRRGRAGIAKLGLEPRGIDRQALAERVSERRGADGLGAEHLAHAQHVVLELLGRRARRPLTPQRVDKGVRAQRVAPTHAEGDEQRPIPPAADRDRAPPVEHLQRPQHPQLHAAERYSRPCGSQPCADRIRTGLRPPERTVKADSTKGTIMRLRLRHAVPVVIAALALGAGSTLLAASTDGGAKDPTPSRSAVSDCSPPPDPCGSDSLDATVIAAANEAARRMIELQTTGSTTLINPVP